MKSKSHDDRPTRYSLRTRLCKEKSANGTKAIETMRAGVTRVGTVRAHRAMVSNEQNATAAWNDMAIALPLVLEWVATRAKAFSGEYDGEALFWALVEAIEESS